MLARTTLRIRVTVLAAAGLVASGLVAGGTSSAAAKTVQCNVKIPIPADKQFAGVELNANIALPAGATAGQRFPTVITVTPYGSDTGAAPGSCNDPDTGEMALTSHGFAVMGIDQRGAGRSSGMADNEGPSVTHDGYHVLSWIQKQKWSNGKVGQIGCSALGMSGLYYLKADQKRVADGLPRAIQTLWADAPPAYDQYRDVSLNPGGSGSGSVAIAAPALIGASMVQNNDPRDPNMALNIANQAASQIAYLKYNADAHTDGEQAFIEDDYWTNPNGHWRSVATGPELLKVPVPVMLTAGWYDLVAISNAALAEWMAFKSSAKRVVILAPHGHCEATAGIEQLGQGDRNTLVRRWFERYLKGVNNGIDKMANVNMFAQNAKRPWTSDTFPLPGTRYTDYFLSGKPSGTTQANDGSLTTARSAVVEGSQTMVHVPTAPTDGSAAAQAASLNFTSEPARAQRLGGLITADIWATVTNPNAPTGLTDANLTVNLSVIHAEGGAVDNLVPGWLRAGNRAVDKQHSTYDGGVLIRPWHYNSKKAYKAVPSGVPQRYLIEVNPLGLQLNSGDRLRVSITSKDADVLLSSAQEAKAAGGTFEVLYGPKYPSKITLPLLPR
jgi:putative CocE/NonD family hydrolase